jgi:RNA polymerase sigma-70 factor (ECF subfamily)
MALSEHTDQAELLSQLRQGNSVAFRKLYDRSAPKLLWKLRRMVKDADEADELLQDLFVKIWEKREQINIHDSFDAYLYRVAQRMAIDYFRRLERLARMHNEVQLGSTEFVHDTEEVLNAKETKRLLDLAIAKLPEQRRIAFTLCKIEGKSHQEAAEIMNISPNTVHNHLVKAVGTVKVYLEESGKVLSPLIILMAISPYK